MGIRTVTTNTDIAACYPVMRELRPQVPESEFVSRVRSQERSGYRLAVVDDGDGIVGVAGFRIVENLAWGRFLYVDDLVVVDHQRSKGCGARLLAWLRERALAEGCQQLHLDSGVQREDAHRFYEREGMAKAGFHFAEALTPDNPVPPVSQGKEIR
ncbi:MAG TPA: GNAT family N-acetyltransferase [Deferrisomatales bacterium]|nr:GNAT family N-acetyltransferase [Deferrisomatales bacterium]